MGCLFQLSLDFNLINKLEIKFIINFAFSDKFSLSNSSVLKKHFSNKIINYYHILRNYKPKHTS